MFVAVLSATGYTLVVKKMADHYNPITITAYQSLYGLIMFIPLFLIIEVPHLGAISLHKESLLALLYLGVFGSGICFILMTVGIRELGAARANIFANLIPIVAAFLSFILLGESMPWLKILGIFLTIFGLFLTQVSSLRAGRIGKRNGIRHIPNA